MSYEEEDTYLVPHQECAILLDQSYEEEDTCMSYEEEDTYLVPHQECAILLDPPSARTQPICMCGVCVYMCVYRSSFRLCVCQCVHVDSACVCVCQCVHVDMYVGPPRCKCVCICCVYVAAYMLRQRELID